MLLLDEPHAAWRQWCERAGVALGLTQGVRLSDAALMWQAAVDGSGVASGRLMLAGDDRRAGRLVCQFEPVLADDHSSWLVASRAAAQRPLALVFPGWLLRAIHAPLSLRRDAHSQSWRGLATCCPCLRQGGAHVAMMSSGAKRGERGWLSGEESGRVARPCPLLVWGWRRKPECLRKRGRLGAASRVRPALKPGRRDSIEAGTYRVRPLPAYFRCALTSLVSSNIVT